MNWYYQIAINSGLSILTALVMRSKLSQQKKADFLPLMAQVQGYIIELGDTAPPAIPSAPPPAG